MRCQRDSTENKKLKGKKRNEQNKTLNEIKKTNKEGEKRVMVKQLEEIESQPTDVKNCFEAVHLLKRKNPKIKLILYNKNGDMVKTENQQADEITFFRSIFGKYNQGAVKGYPPWNMKCLSQRNSLV